MPLNPQRPWIIGHRGVPGEAPENTLSGLELAIRQGADLVEIDLHLSADGQLVVIHDDTVDRTTNGTGRVGDLPFNALRGLDAGSWMGLQFRGEKIPSLSEALEATAGRAGIVVDLKHGSERYQGIEGLLARAIEASQRLDEVMVISGNSAAITRINMINPEVMTLDFRHAPISSPEWLGGKPRSRTGRRFLFAGANELEKERILRLQDLGYGVLCSDINESLSPQALETMLACAVDGIFTDHARAMKVALGR